MARAKPLPTIDQLEKLAGQAAGGNNEALDELGALAEKLGRRANQRMRELEKAGKTGDAYQRIRDSLGGRSRLSQSHTGSAESLLKNAKKALSALSKKESTISGIREVDTKTLRSLYDRFGISGKVTQESVDQFNRFVESDLWNEFKGAMGGSGGYLEQFTKMLADDVQSVDDILDSFESWASMEDALRPDVFEMMDTWFEF